MIQFGNLQIIFKNNLNSLIFVYPYKELNFVKYAASPHVDAIST